MAQILTTPQSDRQLGNQRTNTRSKEVLYNPVNMVSMDLGFVLLVLALCGLFMPNFLGLNLSQMHCWVLAACGCLGIWSGLTTDRRSSMYINFGLGIFFALNAVIGFLVGEPGTDRGVMNVPDDMVVRIAPGFLELSTMDHILHTIVAVFFFIEAFAWLYQVKKKRSLTAN